MANCEKCNQPITEVRRAPVIGIEERARVYVPCGHYADRAAPSALCGQNTRNGTACGLVKGHAPTCAPTGESEWAPWTAGVVVK